MHSIFLCTDFKNRFERTIGVADVRELDSVPFDSSLVLFSEVSKSCLQPLKDPFPPYERRNI